MRAGFVTFPDGTVQTTAATNSIPAGSVSVFIQTAAPTGWTKSTAHDNKALRIVSGTAGSGGSVGFTTAFASQTPAGSVNISGGSVGATTLSTSQISSHNHGLYGQTVGGLGALRNLFESPSNNIASTINSGYAMGYSYNNPYDGAQWMSSIGGGGSHTHSFSAPSGSFSGTAINLAVQYVDAIICTKN